jgi:hypothetical protein
MQALVNLATEWVNNLNAQAVLYKDKRNPTHRLTWLKESRKTLEALCSLHLASESFKLPSENWILIKVTVREKPKPSIPPKVPSNASNTKSEDDLAASDCLDMEFPGLLDKFHSSEYCFTPWDDDLTSEDSDG